MGSLDNEPVEVEIVDSAAVVRFIRPELKNPLSIKTLEHIRMAFSSLNSRQDIRTIIFTGTGNTFASGANLNEVSRLNEKTAAEFGLRGQNLMGTIYGSEKFTVAAINGFCLGGALDLALSCKRRIANSEAFFAQPGAGLGIITGWGGTQLLPRLVGRKNALEMFLAAKPIGADDALRIGLIDEINEDPLAKSFEQL